MGKIFFVEFQRFPLKFHTKYHTHTLKDVNFIYRWKFQALRFKSSWVFLNAPQVWSTCMILEMYSIQHWLIDPWETQQTFLKGNFETHLTDWYMSIFCEIALLCCHRTHLMISQHQFRYLLVATGHYLSQCWPMSVLSYGLTRSQWVNIVVTSTF